MKITSIVSNNLNKRGNHHFKSRVIYSYPKNDISQNLKDRIDDFEENPFLYKKLGEGKSAEVYHLHPYNLVIKKQLQSYTKGDNFEHEAVMLGKVPATFYHSQQLEAQVKTEKNNFYLVSTLVQGKSPNAKDNPMNENDIKNIFDSLFELDKAKIYHFDLNNNNILLTQDAANIIDYQWAQTFEYYDSQYENQEKGIIFPENVIPNNALNYESTGFASYLYDYYKINGRNETREFVKKYLIQKAKYCEKRHDYFRKTAKENGIYYKSQNEIEQGSSKHRYSVYQPIKYERAIQKVYENPNDDVIDIEIARMEMLKSDKKAYYFIDPNIDEKRNTFGAVPYYANAIISLNAFRKTLDKLEDKYKDDKYMSAYISYNKNIAYEHSRVFNEWYLSSFELLKRVAKNKLCYWERDREVTVKENKLKHFGSMTTLDGILLDKNNKKSCSDSPNKILIPENEKIQNIYNSFYSLMQESELKNKSEIQEIFKEFKKALEENRQIDAFSISFIFRRILIDVKSQNNNISSQISSKFSELENDIDLYIDKSVSKLMNVLYDKNVPDVSNDFKLRKIEVQAKPVYTSSTTKQAKPQSVLDKIKKWWDSL